jgi:branched-chain amino acid transport system permease protein
MYTVIWVIVLLSAYGTLRIASSRLGLAWKLLGEHQEVAESVGVDPQNRKMQALVLSAGFGSVSGSLYAHYTQVVSPVSFGFSLLVVLLITVVLGGLGTGYGPVLGAITVGLITMRSGSAGEYTSIVFGVVFLVVLYAAPVGLVGVIRSLLPRLGLRRADAPTPQPVERTTLDIGAEFAALRRLLGADEAANAGDYSLHGVTKSFGGVAANTDVSIDVRGGEVLGVIGPNGAGKSTAVNIATGTYRPDSGTVSWCGEDISQWSTDRRAAAGVARTFQKPSVVPGITVIENVAIGAYRFGHRGLVSAVFTPAGRRELEELFAAALKALEIVGLDHLAQSDSESLSFGQRRLAELARAIVSLPEVIFLDEPMSGLDASEKEQIVDLLKGLRDAGVAVCIIEHDTQTIARICDRICVLDFGKVLCVGTPEEVFNDPRVKESYMGETVEI